MSDASVPFGQGDETFEMIGPGHTYESVTEKIGSLVLNNEISRGWLLAVGFVLFAAFLMLSSMGI